MVATLGVAALFACATAAAAQTSATTTGERWDAKQSTITGCVEKNKSGGFFLTHAMSQETSSPASHPSTTGTAGHTATTTSSTSATTWNLENGDHLDRYVGQKVQVMGRAEKSTSGDQLKGTTGSHEIKARDFDVKSVKMISTTCR
jgi:hypothetical protein